MSIQNALTLIKDNLEVDLIPVLIGALKTYEANPTVAGALAAEAYLLGNAPAALLTGQVQILQQGINDLNADLARLQSAAAATLTAPAKPA